MAGRTDPVPQRTITESETINGADFGVWIDASSAAVTLTMPRVATVHSQVFELVVKDETNNIFIDPNGVNINGVSGLFQIYEGEAITLHNDGSNYRII